MWEREEREVRGAVQTNGDKFMHLFPVSMRGGMGLSTGEHWDIFFLGDVMEHTRCHSPLSQSYMKISLSRCYVNS